MTYIKKSVPRAEGNPGTGIQPRDQLTLIDIDDIAFMPSADDKGVVIADNIVMKPGRYGYNIYMTQGTIEVTSAAEGDTDKIGFTPSIKFEHPGNEQEVREFKANSINRKFIVVIRYCSGKPADLIGTICNPCKLTPSYTGNNESNTNEMTFTQISKGSDIFIYKGTVTLEEPVSVVETGVRVVPFISEGQYQLTAGAAVIDEIEGGAHDAVITLLGAAGGSSPTVSGTGGKILLRGGKVFTASEGSQLTLRAFDSGDGGIMWIEQSRYVAA
ncbi:hypothetical protein [uncultured Alistipes sp.]|uniref:hypothetical protein n=1 Tax=uncultured Alistipes sp. TaxID=538949 RepID=UPI00272BEB3B|nr:hypothetical protein [uncultured Alistipes sp.]